MFFKILCYTNPIDTLLRTIFHISNIRLKFLSNTNCKSNEIKGMKPCNSSQSSLDDPTDWLLTKTQLLLKFFYARLQLTIRSDESLFTLCCNFICCVGRYTSVKIKPELKKYILKFGYGINYKYGGMLAHSFDRFYVFTKFILPTINDLKFWTIKYDEKCEYLQQEKGCADEAKDHILDHTTYCRKIRPFVHYYRGQTNSFNHTAHNILNNETGLILHKKKRREVLSHHYFRLHRFSIWRHF